MAKPEYLQFGGQAVVEGVMMRSPRYFSVACRAPNGEIELQAEEVEKTWIGRQKWLKLPFLRGSLALLDSMALGAKAMRFAAQVQIKGEEQQKIAAGDTTATQSAKVQDTAVGGAMVVGILFGLFVFVFLPNAIAEQSSRIGVTSWMEKNLITEILKIVFFVGYIYAISLLPEIARLFQYHGAEHKAINTFEAEQELSIENCRKQTRLHPRCGTSFAIIVLLTSLLLFTFVPRYPFASLEHSKLAAVTVRFFLELLILPLVSGFAYEAIRFAGKFRNQKFVMALFWPGLMTQYLTTKEPDDSQIEVALAALKAVMPEETAKLAASAS
ncbi:MAG: DUF1385 domain-containing protein [Armatimonadetes bacterium]|nr:DUF1385 domain-containing protein [Armatimonadota bacterium]